MSIQTFGTFLTQLNGLEILGIGIVYLILNNGGRLLYNRFKKKDNNSHFELQLKEHIDRAIKIFNIREYITLKKQMIKVDGAIEACFDQFLLNYVNFLREKYKSDDISGAYKDIDYYEKICEHISIKISEMIKNRIKENYILDRTDEEFRNYAEQTTKDIVAKTVALLDYRYNSTYFLISRNELKTYNKQYLEKYILPILNNMWLNIRAIAKRADAEIKELEK